MVVCPECDGNVVVAEGTLKGEVLSCADCGAELEVVSENPVELKVAPDAEEDWGE